MRQLSGRLFQEDSVIEATGLVAGLLIELVRFFILDVYEQADGLGAR